LKGLLTALAIAAVCSAGACRYFWISADGLESMERLDSLLVAASSAGANGLIVQVMGRGEAWYLSDLLPPAYILDTYDPLAYLISRAHPMGMEVHAWVNAFLTWSAPDPPSDPAHVYYVHPDWFMADLRGRSSRSYTREECDAAGIVGATLSPVVDGVRERLADICVEIAQRYDVDGIHLDYVRYPGKGFGFESEARAGFFLETGLDPVDLYAAPGRSAAAVPGREEEWLEWRARQVTSSVRTVRAALRREAPNLPLSCAVMADPLSAIEDYGCDWRSWLQEGLVDFVCPMAYSTSASRASELAVLDTAVRPERVVYGIAVYNQTLESALRGAADASSRGSAGTCVYSLNTFSIRDAPTLRSFWGSGSPEQFVAPAVFHRLARFSE
jgi:uncharacterized lipoprotein YddW (UPF0748 family)